MSDITVGPIQHYVPGSTWFDLNKYSQLGTQERVSVNLTSSNLWLIDSSQLYLDRTYAPRIAFLNEGAGYQSPIKLTASGATNGTVTVFNNLSGYDSIMPNSSGPLWRGDWVQLSEMQAGTQLDFSVIPNGVFQPTRTPLSTNTSLNPTSPYNPNSPVFWAAYADPTATKPLIILGYEDILGSGSDNDFNDGLIILDVGTENFQRIFQSSNLGQDPTINLSSAQPIPVPLNFNSSLGLVLLLVLAIGQRFPQLIRKLYSLLNMPQT